MATRNAGGARRRGLEGRALHGIGRGQHLDLSDAADPDHVPGERAQVLDDLAAASGGKRLGGVGRAGLGAR